MALGNTEVLPDLLGLEVGLKALGGITLEVGDVEAVLGETVDTGEEVPGHGQGAELEVVAERPVSKHLEEGVVV